MKLKQEMKTPGTGGPTPATDARKSVCPGESQLLAYYENNLGIIRRKRIEKHMQGCDLCRDSLALLVRVREETKQEADSGAIAGLEIRSDRDVDDRVARVLALIEMDDARHPQPVERLGRSWRLLPGPAFAAIAAFLVLAIGAVVIYRLYVAGSAEQEGRQAIELATSKARRNPLTISSLSYSPYDSAMRGDDKNVNVAFESAWNKLKSAKDSSAPPGERLMLARLYLARSQGDDEEQALGILHDLADAGVQTPQVLNDTGVALYGLRHNAEAVDYFTKALKADPGMTQALFNRAVAEEGIDRQAARQDYQKFIDTASNQDWISEARDRLKKIA